MLLIRINLLLIMFKKIRQKNGASTETISCAVSQPKCRSPSAATCFSFLQLRDFVFCRGRRFVGSSGLASLAALTKAVSALVLLKGLNGSFVHCVHLHLLRFGHAQKGASFCFLWREPYSTCKTCSTCSPMTLEVPPSSSSKRHYAGEREPPLLDDAEAYDGVAPLGRP
jgi:hypothetical protein